MYPLVPEPFLGTASGHPDSRGCWFLPHVCLQCFLPSLGLGMFPERQCQTLGVHSDVDLKTDEVWWFFSNVENNISMEGSGISYWELYV